MQVKYHIAILILLLGLACDPELSDPELPGNLPVMHIDIQPAHMVLLKRKRERALQEGMLRSKTKDYVPAKVRYGDRTLGASLRLKGDWLDHLKGRKWSMRIKLDTEHPALGMRSFSIQHPKTRSYIDEWVFHRLLSKVGILTPRYQFVQVVLNGRVKGIFALEEHFEKQLLEQAARREGPIFKFNESGFWEIQRHRMRTGVELGYYLPEFEAAVIEAFQEGHTLREPGLRALFEIGSAKMEQYQRAIPEIDHYLHLDQMARFYALADVCKAYHALRWHNLRFYYNPITARLEPVVFDSFAENGAYAWFSKPYLGFHDERHGKIYFAEDYLIFYLFNHPKFPALYRDYLKQYSAPGFLNDFFEDINPDLEVLQEAMTKEFPGHPFSPDSLRAGAARVRELLPQMEDQQPPFVYTIYPSLYDSCYASYPLPAISLKVEAAGQAYDGSQLFEVGNYYCQALRLFASGPKKSKPIHPLDPPIILSPFDIYQQPPPLSRVSIPQEDRYLFFEELDRKRLYHQKISTRARPKRIKFLSEQILQIDTSVFSVEGHTIHLRAGLHQVNQLILIPQSHTLIIDPGAQLDLVDSAYVLVFGAVQMKGQSDKRIHIYSSDKTSRGWHIIGSPEQVLIQHTTFESLNTLAGPERWLSSGVTIYEAPVQIEGVELIQSQSEDALNIIRSPRFTIKDIQFYDCQSDALDIDFSNGRLEGGRFEQVGGDAIDCSGSMLEIERVRIQNVADKGISIGEASQVDLSDVQISDMRLGIATKDASSLKSDSVFLRNAQYGLAVFNKKPVYGPAEMYVERLSMEAIQQDYLLALDHVLLIDQEAQRMTDSTISIRQLLYPELIEK